MSKAPLKSLVKAIDRRTDEIERLRDIDAPFDEKGFQIASL